MVTSTYPVGSYNPWSITAGPDGSMWFALTNLWGGIGRITTSVTPGHHQPHASRGMLAGEMSGR